MKANLKGQSGIKGLMLMHGEKLGIGLVGLLALWLVYSSLSIPRLESNFQATNLQQEISQTKSQVDQTEWPSPDSEQATNVFYAKEIAKSADATVKADPYLGTGAGFTPVIPPTQRRADPELLNAVEVRAIGGSGLFAFVDDEIRKQQQLRQQTLEEERAKLEEKRAQQQQRESELGRQPRRGREENELGPVDPEHPNRRTLQGMSRTAAGVPLQGGERIERASWACVVAKVPIREQLKLYLDAFENARGFNPNNDFPRYLGYYVERSEVVRGQPLDWKRVGLYDGQQKSIIAQKSLGAVVSSGSITKLFTTAQKEWAGVGIEPVDPRYIDQMLTLPLPPLVGREFGADATHPDIPLAINAPPPEQETAPLADQAGAEAADPDDPAALFSANPNQAQMLGGRPGGIGPQMGPGYSREMMGGPGSYMGPESMGGMRGEMGPGGQATALPRGVDFFLLRFFDFTVQPGKKYKYRVKLVLADPNVGHPDSTLEPAVQDRLRASKRAVFREISKFSEPSPTVGIPLAGSVQLAEVKLPSGNSSNDEPVVKLMVEVFDVSDEGTAVHVAIEKDYRRGAVVNLKEKMEYTGDGDRWIDSFDSYAIHTGVTLLDVAGGEKLSKDMSAPARVMLMDPSGELSIRKELDDSTSVAYLRLLFSDEMRGEGGEGMMPGMPSFGREGAYGPGGPR